MYQEIKPLFDGHPAESVKRIFDGAFIPFAPDNVDYQAYLKWLDDGNVPLSSEEGNTPEPADNQGGL